jgi:hypothetical protein
VADHELERCDRLATGLTCRSLPFLSVHTSRAV